MLDHHLDQLVRIEVEPPCRAFDGKTLDEIRSDRSGDHPRLAVQPLAARVRQVPHGLNAGVKGPPYVAGAMGITGVPATRFEAACASSGAAFFHAVSAVGAGLYDIVMVNGVEKMTSQPTPKVAEILAGAGDTNGEVKAGATFPAL